MEKSKHRVTPENLPEIAMLIAKKQLEDKELLYEEAVSFEEHIAGFKLDAEISPNIRENIALVDAMAEFFSSDRRVFLDMELWIFFLLANDFEIVLFSEENQALRNEIFPVPPEEIMRREDSSWEEKQFIKKHFGGRVVDYIEAGGSRYMRRWKEKNSRVNFDEPRDQS